MKVFKVMCLLVAVQVSTQSSAQQQDDDPLVVPQGTATETVAPSEKVAWEALTDRPGYDFKNFWLDKDIEAFVAVRRCEDACRENGQCKAFTYVKPGIQGPDGRCFLKYVVPDAVKNDCCTSGIVRKTKIDFAVGQKPPETAPGVLAPTLPDTEDIYVVAGKPGNPIWEITKPRSSEPVGWDTHPPNPRFAIYRSGSPDPSDHVVLDQETGLVWERIPKACPTPQDPTTQLWDEDTNIPGHDYKKIIPTGNVAFATQQCKESCIADKNCRAFTYVKPGTMPQHPQGRCFLKDDVTGKFGNTCCNSGVIRPYKHWSEMPHNYIGDSSLWNAFDRCKNLSLGGRRGWRLPTIEELFSLSGDSPAPEQDSWLPSGHPFQISTETTGVGGWRDPLSSETELHTVWYWTGTPDLTNASERVFEDQNRHRAVSFRNGGYSASFRPAVSLCSFCVRGGSLRRSK